MKKLIVFIIATLLTFGAGVLSAPTANAEAVKVFDNGTVRLEKADRKIQKRELAYVEFRRDGRAYIEFNDGSAWRFAPCEYEDSPLCFWDARTAGNRVGDSFIRYGGKTFYLKTFRL